MNDPTRIILEGHADDFKVALNEYYELAQDGRKNPENYSIKEQLLSCCELLRNIVQNGTTTFFCTSLEQVQRLLLQQNVLYAELESRIEPGLDPAMTSAYLEELEILTLMQLEPHMCHSYQVCQALRLMLFTARMTTLNVHTTSADVVKLFNSKYVDDFLLNRIGDYTVTPLRSPLAHLQAVLSPALPASLPVARGGAGQASEALPPIEPVQGEVVVVDLLTPPVSQVPNVIDPKSPYLVHIDVPLTDELLAAAYPVESVTQSFAAPSTV